jgi:hypothetical protein
VTISQKAIAGDRTKKQVRVAQAKRPLNKVKMLRGNLLIFFFIEAPSGYVFSAQGAAFLKGATVARQPCCRIPKYQNLGQWLCVPPFRAVCLYQAIR